MCSVTGSISREMLASSKTPVFRKYVLYAKKIYIVLVNTKLASDYLTLKLAGYFATHIQARGGGAR